MSIQFIDRMTRLPGSSSEIQSRFQYDHWMMTDAERSALTMLLNNLRPDCAIEIGTYKAGSTGVISRFSRNVYSVDIDPTCRENYGKKFDNVNFLCGDSKEILEPLLEKLCKLNQILEFVLIDGGHSEVSVRSDIEAILRYTPSKPLYIIMHDSFNPDCRKGILSANWALNPNVHMLEIDYIPGRFIDKEEEGSYRQMWCGFALAVLLPQQRQGDILIHQNESLMFQTAYWRSGYPFKKFRTKYLSPNLMKKKIKTWIRRTKQ